MSVFVVKMAQVVHVEPMGASTLGSDCCAMRVKAKTAQDTSSDLNEIPYAFPLMPKMIQTAPKVGECVLVIMAEAGNSQSNRYYIGPIISQPQKMEKDNYNFGRGTAIATLESGKLVGAMETIANYPTTEGAFPKQSDVALIGRCSEDIILRDKEIDIRCGVRGEPTNQGEGGLQGKVVFNDKNPSYIQLKMRRNGSSVMNLVADNVNILSHKNVETLDGNITLADKAEMIPEKEMEALQAQLHLLPYGDILVDCLSKLRDAVTNHVHPWPGIVACDDYSILALKGFDLNSILSTNIRIS